MKEIVGLVLDIVDGRSCPRFICQYCHKPILKAGDAMFAWHLEDGNVYAVHKRYACERPELYDDSYECTMELRAEIIYLMWNSGIRTKAEIEAAQENAEALGLMMP